MGRKPKISKTLVKRYDGILDKGHTPIGENLQYKDTLSGCSKNDMNLYDFLKKFQICKTLEKE